jgi:hypothetical protein
MTAQETREPGQPAAARWPGGSPRPVLGTLAVLGLAGYAWVASGLPPFSGRALVGVLIPGAALGLVGYGRPPDRIPAPERIDVTGFSYWAICVAALLEWEASAIWLLAGWALIRR